MRAPVGTAGTLLALILVGACTPQVAVSPGATSGTGTATGSATGATSAAVTTPPADSLRAPSPTSVNPPGPQNGLPPVINRIDTTDKVVFLTIDDGYTKDPKTADLIKARGVPVTPFLTRNAIQDNKAYFAGISELTGQTIQNHSITHPQLPKMSESGQQREICDTSTSYQEWFGQRPWMLRPPYGEWNPTTKQAARVCGIQYLVMWDVSLPTSQLRYAEGSKLRTGDIILTHWRPDLYRHLPGALDDIVRQGFKIAALQDYLPRR